MLLACVMLFSVLVAPEVEAKEETVTQIAEMRAMGQFDFELPPKTLMKANSSFPMERGETVKITASYSPESASVDFGLILMESFIRYGRTMAASKRQSK